MLFTDVQRSVRLNKKKKPTNTSPYPDEVIDRLARAFYPAILACWNSEEGQREFAAWQAEQAHHTTSKEKQSVPDGERPVVHIAIVCGFWQGASESRVPIKQYLQKLPKWGRFGVTSVTPFLLLPNHPEGYILLC